VFVTVSHFHPSLIFAGKVGSHPEWSPFCGAMTFSIVAFSIMTFSIMTLSIMTFSITTFSIMTFSIM
jgi:hypothetical protein